MQFLDNFARSGEELGILLEDDAVLRSGFKSLLRKARCDDLHTEPDYLQKKEEKKLNPL